MPADRKGRKVKEEGPGKEKQPREARKERIEGSAQEKVEPKKERPAGQKEARPADEGVVRRVGRRRAKRKISEEEEEGPLDLGPQQEYKNPMQKPQLEKVVVNIGVGEAGEKVSRAATLLESLTNQKPLRTAAKKTNRDLNIRKGDLIGCKVTLRKEKARAFLKRALDAVDGRVRRRWFDNEGNFSFGIDEHINIPGVQYDPSVGIYGMDVCVAVARKGNRVKLRRTRKSKVPRRHRVGKLEAMRFVRDSFGVTVV